jgi:hypothetical protein
LRPCGDYRMVNTQIEKMAPNLPTGLHQLEQAAGHSIYFEADSVACYNSFRLAPGLSREALAIWTPIGLVQPTVLPFGQKNSDTEAQGPYLNAAKRLKKISNYVDDWHGYANDFDELLRNFEDFLKVCLEYNITLNAAKTRFRFASAQFFGFVASFDGTRLADRHLCPIQNMVPPEDIAELRRTLGLFVVSRKYIKDYAMITKPLTNLLKGKQLTFLWGKACPTRMSTLGTRCSLAFTSRHLTSKFRFTSKRMLRKMARAPYYISSRSVTSRSSSHTARRRIRLISWLS